MRLLSKRQLKELVLYCPQHIQRLENANRFPKRVPPKPSVFTPFFRRFTDERALDIAETRKLYASITERHRSSKWCGEESAEDFAEYLYGEIGVEVPEPLRVPVFGLLVELLQAQPMASRR